ncbi:MAG: polysaccharide deacetylase family protein [Gemmataceae bacterium]
MVGSALLGLYKHSGLMALQSAVRRKTGRTHLSIVLFHRVTDAIPPDGLTVGTAWFQDFCALMRRSYRVISLAEAFQYANDSHPIPPNTVAITFDDTYADNLPASRILAAHRLPATFFVSTSYVGNERSYPWDAHLPKLPNLSWDDLREMMSLGHEIGSHSADHSDFGKIDAETALRELTESKRILEEQLRKPTRWFAYPFGGCEHFRPEFLPLVYEAGYQGCVSAYGGSVVPGMKGKILPREAMPYFKNLTHMELHLSGCFDWIYACKRRLGWIR